MAVKPVEGAMAIYENDQPGVDDKEMDGKETKESCSPADERPHRR